MDQFLTEICHVHDLRASIRELSEAERSNLIRNMVDVEGIDSEAGDWIFDARDAQVPPRGLDWAWLLSADAAPARHAPRAPASTWRCAPASNAST
jgi:hypothetical protein